MGERSPRLWRRQLQTSRWERRPAGQSDGRMTHRKAPGFIFTPLTHSFKRSAQRSLTGGLKRLMLSSEVPSVVASCLLHFHFPQCRRCSSLSSPNPPIFDLVTFWPFRHGEVWTRLDQVSDGSVSAGCGVTRRVVTTIRSLSFFISCVWFNSLQYFNLSILCVFPHTCGVRVLMEQFEIRFPDLPESRRVSSLFTNSLARPYES